ncbi:MAG: hypothetical protein PVI11_01990 [Candidatus Aminicenantes bacterium]|jgi:hypothetical protein
MNCKKFEKRILRAFDERLRDDEKKELEEHLHSCPLCSATQEEYRAILNTLKTKDFPEPKPYFWERLQSKLEKSKKVEPWMLWKQWGMRAIPVSLLLILFLSAALLLLSPPEEEVELTKVFSQSGILLLEDQSPLQETTALLETAGIEDKNMILIFTALEENNGTRRDFK